ncbi:MAG: hypothetical protein ACOYKJ_08585 [Candidatus Howiella sp.]|jgi:mRNA deadenylase 3'-5' endonuclease subunit Ccr4
MRRKFKSAAALFLALLLAFSMTAGATLEDFIPTADEEYLHLMSFNLRYDTTSHGAMSTSVRGPHLLSLIAGYDVDSVGFQEATNDWMRYLRPEMEKLGYGYVGVGRDSGTDDVNATGTGNEFSPVFYKTEKYRLIEGDTFWLSETPDQKSGTAWNASNTRICTYAVLENRETGERYIHFNTHLDHVSDLAKENGIRIITARIARVSETYGNIPSVATGDYNSLEESTVHNVMTSVMDDSKSIAKSIVVGGKTFSEYQNPDAWESGNLGEINSTPNVDYTKSPIDFIFLTKGMFEVNQYTVVNDMFTFDYNGTTYHNHPCSDHFGVYCEAKPITDAVPQHSAEGITDIPANQYVSGKATPSAATLSVLEGLENLAWSAEVSSNLLAESGAGKTVDLQLASGKYSGRVFWEVTFELDGLTNLSTVAFAAGEADTLPGSVEILGSADGASWNTIGDIVRPVVSGDTYTVLNALEGVRYVKLVMADAPSSAVLQNIRLYGFCADTVRKIDNAAEVTVLAGPRFGESNSEGVEKAFDGKGDTKLYSKPAISTDDIVWKVDAGPVEALRYGLTTGGDTAQYTNRNPTDWVLYGSSDGEDWSVIDAKAGCTDLPKSNSTEILFDIAQPVAYTYYKLHIDYDKIPAEAGEHKMQLSEISLYIDSGKPLPTDETLYTVRSVLDEAPALSVEAGTPATALSLPETVQVVLSSGVEVNCPVVWDTSTYLPDKSEEQRLIGSLLLTGSGWLNPEDIVVTATVRVNTGEETSLPGDLDDNGILTVSDVVELRSVIIAGNPTARQVVCGDLDGDGLLTVSDVVELRSRIVSG